MHFYVTAERHIYKRWCYRVDARKMVCGVKKSIDLSESKKKAVCLISVCVFFLIVSFFNNDYNSSNAEHIIWIVSIFAILALICIYAFFKIPFYKFSFLFIIIIGGMVLFIQPINNVPDETAHLTRAEVMSRGDLIVDPDLKVYTTIQSVADIRENIESTYVRSDLRGDKIDYSLVEIDQIAATNLSFLYIPQTIGVLLAKLLNLDVIWLLWLPRLTNLLFYTFIISYAIKIAPKLKFVLFFLAALPMSIQQAASCSPDVIINGVSFLFIAYFLKVYCEDAQMNLRKKCILLILGIIITVSKISNIFLVGLVLLIPDSKFSNKRRALMWKGFTVVAVSFLCICYYLYTTGFATNLTYEVYFESRNINSAEQIQYILNNFLQWIKDFGSNLINYSYKQVDMLNQFGMLRYGYPFLSLVTVFVFSKISFQEKGIFLRTYDKILILLMILGIYSTTFLALYLSWTPVGASDIEGVQGRYFIPMLGLVALLFSSSDRPVKKDYLADVTVTAGMLGVMMIIMTFRYY